MNTKLLCRPWSCHRPKVAGYEPSIRPRIHKIGRGKHGWRCEILVDDCPMAISHHATKAKAEIWAEGMLEAYTQVHYCDRGAA